MFRYCLLALPLLGLQAAGAAAKSPPAADSASPSSANLQRFHDVLETNSRRYFGDDEEAFRSAVDWHHSRLRAAGEGEATAGDGATPIPGGAGTGTFVVFTSHRRAAEARSVLTRALSASSVVTAAHNREQGGCFLVHASANDVDALLLRHRDGGEDSDLAGERNSGDDGGAGLFEGFVAVPPSLKLAPSLLDLGRIFDEDDVDNTAKDERPRLISPGKALRRNRGGEGLVVLLLSSPNSADDDDRRARELALAGRWRQDWSSPSLDLHSLSFWSDPDGHSGCHSHHSKEAEDGEGTGADVLAAEWEGAARAVDSLAERLGGVSPAEACGWNDIMVAAEGGGSSPSSSEWMTLRNIGHLLPGENPDRDVGQLSLGSSSDEQREREKTACLMGLVSFLAAQPQVARISALPRAELSNAVAGRIVQGASATTSPVWDLGVDGSGQVVQVIDSGVAQGSCFFRDSATTLGPDHGYLRDSDGSLGSGDFQYDLSQRKVVQYIEGTQGSPDYVDDDEDGHGSHVAGSVAGSIYSDWSGPSSCPDGVAGATEDQTAVSCVGRCLAPSVMADFISDNYFDLDALCPEYECDVYWDNICLSDDRSETLQDAKGVAPGARLAILDLGTSDRLYQALGGTMWEAAAGTGARLHSASWGFPDDPCTVDEAAVSFDQWAYENPEHLLVFAAGNLGDDMSGCSIASPSISKNSLAVGSSMSGAVRLSSGDLDEVSDFSSKGPTSDGRIKPDVLAPGHYIFSAANGGDGSCELDRNSGTSMSCPVAAGAAALVRQYLVDGFYADDLKARGGLCTSADPAWACDSFSPSGALVKAVLIHSGDAMGGSTDPDGEKGFGRIHLEAGMPFDGEGVWALYVEDDDGTTTSTGQVEAAAVEERSFTITEEDVATAVDGGSSGGPGGIRATLVWMDPPATASSSVQLIHDLDLFLEGPEGSVWTMSGKCSSDEASCSLDSRNNVERIVVPTSDITAGTWTVKVSANGLVEGGPQSYALVVSLPISTGGASTPTDLPAAIGVTPAPVVSGTTTTPTAAAVGSTTSPTVTPGPTAAEPSSSSEDAAPTSIPTLAGSTPTPTTEGLAAPTPTPTAAAAVGGSATATPSHGGSDDDEEGGSGVAAGNAPPSPAPTVDPTGTGASATVPPASPSSSSSVAGSGPTSSPSGGAGRTSSPSAGTPTPAVVIAAPPGQGNDGPTPAPVIIIASPGGSTGGDTSTVIVGGRAETPSPVAVTSDGGDGSASDGEGIASGVGGTPSPESGVDASNVSGAVRAVGGSGGGVGGVVVGAVSVAAAIVMAAA